MVTMGVAVCSTVLSLFSSVLAAYAIQRLRFKGSQYVGLAIYLAYLVPPSILFIPLATTIYQLGLFDSPLALILTYPTFLVPFSTWLLIGYFKSIPYELEECALIDGATRLQILRRITLPLAVPGLISAGIFSFTLSWNEFIYALAFIQSSEKKTVPVAHPDRAGVGRRLSVGLADGGLAAGLAAGRDLLFVLRRLLRLLADRRGEGVGHPLNHATGPGGPVGCGVGGGWISGVGASVGGISGGFGCALPGVGGVDGMSGGLLGLSAMIMSP